MKSTIELPDVTEAQFTATKFNTAKEKYVFLMKLCQWIIDGMDEKTFLRADKPLYYHLHLHMNHIAHFDRQGFWDHWFSDAPYRLNFLDHHMNMDLFGDPAHTWSDVRGVFKNWIGTSGILAKYQDEAKAYRNNVDMAIARKTLNSMDPVVRQQLLKEFVTSDDV